MLNGKLERQQFTSTLLRSNRLGDPAERMVYVYLPPGYDGKQRYPVVMALAGYGATNHSFLNYNFFEPNLVERFDHLIVSKRCRPALLVLPDAINRWGGSQFLDSSATGNYQSYLVDEVIPWVDRNYRTIPRREGRAAVGHSSGGFGALRLGLDRPEAVGVIGSHAGDSAFELSILPDLRDAAMALEQAGGMDAFLKQFAERPKAVDFNALMMIALAAAYAPLPESECPHAQLPFDPTTGALREDVWRRWRMHDPLERIERDPAALTTTSLVYIDAGDRDEHGLHYGARRMTQVLKERGVHVHSEEFEGGHRGTGYRYDVSLPLLAGALADA